MPNQLPPGLVSSITSARLRVTDHERVLSLVEQIDVDPLCLLQSMGIDAVEAEIEDGLITQQKGSPDAPFIRLTNSLVPTYQTLSKMGL